ncbi:MAG TPA: hypothetical protein VFK30_04250, partial [Anaerolineae bacterium]|nr:hypothetical protein [Anaerolineae bacterium]
MQRNHVMVLETKQLIIRSLGESDIPAVLLVYQAGRDFFDLQTAEELSGELIQAELTRAKKSGSEFAGIFS